MGVKRDTGLFFFDQGRQWSSFLVTAISQRLSSSSVFTWLHYSSSVLGDYSQQDLRGLFGWEKLLKTKSTSLWLIPFWFLTSFWSHLQPKVWLILHLLILHLSVYLSIYLNCWSVFALEEQLRKCLRELQPFPSSSHMQDYLKVRVKGQHHPGTISGSNLCWICGAGRVNPALLGLCWGRTSCPSPQWGALLQLDSSAVFSSKWVPGRRCWAAEPHPALASHLPPSGHREHPAVAVPWVFEMRVEELPCQRRNIHI